MKLFVDTWGWLTLYNQRELRHQETKRYYQRVRQQQWLIYTSDYVLDETFTLLFRRLSFAQARYALENMEAAVAQGYTQLEWVTPERFAATKLLRLRFQDKPLISFTDLTSMVIMQELGIQTVLTGDAHFSIVGMGFRSAP